MNRSGQAARHQLGVGAYRRYLQAGSDTAASVAGLLVAVGLRYGADPPRAVLGQLALLVPVMVVIQIAAGVVQGLYVGRWRFGGFEEVAALARSVTTTAAVMMMITAVSRSDIPLSLWIGQALVTLVFSAAVRWVWRLALERDLRPRRDDLRQVLVFGAGEAGIKLVESMLRTPDSPYMPVAILDDDRRKQSLRTLGVPVVGGRDQLAAAAEEYGVRTVIVAIPSADAVVIREVAALASKAGLTSMVLPPVLELLGPVGFGDVRPVTEADLLGRRQIDTDVDAIAGYLTDRRVLVTGAGGSIGSELCRQIDRFAPRSLVMVDRDESGLHAVQLSLEGRAMLDDRNLVVADIRDTARMLDVFEEHEPQVVFHAAALKHLPLLEMYPEEAWKTNAWGTQNLLDCAQRSNVDYFVNISTDKAAEPGSVLGSTKRIAERLTAAAAIEAGRPYVSVRFGNVLGSRGSVLTAFRSQIDNGGPITVTHPDVTRYFMTVEEAVELVIQAGAIGDGGDALVLDMGEPVRIDDLARRLIDQSGRRAAIVYTGLRPGEKLHEVLVGSDEVAGSTSHPSVSRIVVPPISSEILVDSADLPDGKAAAAELHRLATSPADDTPTDSEMPRGADR